MEGVKTPVIQDDSNHQNNGEAEPQQVAPMEDLLGDCLSDAEFEGLLPASGGNFSATTTFCT